MSAERNIPNNLLVLRRKRLEERKGPPAPHLQPCKENGPSYEGRAHAKGVILSEKACFCLSLSFFSLVFLKNQGKTSKTLRIFLTFRTLEIPKNRSRKHSKKPRKSPVRKRPRQQKHQGKEGQGRAFSTAPS